MPDPGRFVHKLYLYNPVQTDTIKGDKQNVYGDSNPPTGGHLIRGEVEPVVGRELVVARGIKEDVTHKIKCWFTPLITGLTRIYWNNGVRWVRFDVASPISPGNFKRELEIYGCEISR